MTDERDLDAQMQRLFAAAREERPAHPLRLVVPERRRGGAPAWLLAAVLAAGAAATVVGLRQQRAPEDLELMPEPLTPRAPASATAAVVASASSAPARVAPPPSMRRLPPPRLLADELAELEQARRALSANDPASALQKLDAYDQSSPRRLAAEALALRVEVLTRAGRGDEARAVARRFLEQYPNHPLVDRVQETASSSP